MNPTQRSIVSGKANLAVWDAGAGPLLIFLHAGVADSRMWSAQLAALASTYRSIAYDRRGFGETQHVDEDYSQIDDLLAVIKAGGWGPAILVGCSQGGRVALDATLRHPELVKALVLIAPAVSGAPPVEYPNDIAAIVAELDEAESAGNLELANELEARLWLDGPTSLPGRVAGAARELFHEMNGIALRAEGLGNSVETANPAYLRLSEIGVPTLLVWGDLDFPHIQARCGQIAQLIPTAELEVIKGVAHLPSLEAPEMVTDIIRRFVGLHC